MAQGISPIQVAESGATDGGGVRLIAARSVVNDIQPTQPDYFNPLSVADGQTVSIDKIRVSLTMNDPDWLIGHADTFCPSADVDYWAGRGGIGSYHSLWRYPIGDSSVTLGAGQREKGGRVNGRKAFVELNPNKTALDESLWNLLDRMAGHVKTARMMRYDLALDVAQPRENFRMVRDRRRYETVQDVVMTEYLGMRNRAGRVKLYDKSFESGLAEPLTRIELTCDGDWTAADIQCKWPTVCTWDVPEDTRGWVRALGMMLAEKISRGEEVESYLSMLGRTSRAKVRECCQTGRIELPESVTDYALNQSKKWCEIVSGDMSLPAVFI